MPRYDIDLNPYFLNFLVEVEIDNHSAVKKKLASENKPVPPPIRVKGLIDTGATVCSTSDRIIKALKLPTKNQLKQPFNGASGSGSSYHYYGGFFLTPEPEIKAEYVTILETDFTKFNFEFIIGMTALMRWKFWYTNAEKKLTIEV